MTDNKSNDQAEPKMIILVRDDLVMPVGKLGAQLAHAPFLLFQQNSKFVSFEHQEHMMIPVSSIELQWLQGHYPKVLLAVKSEQQLLSTIEKAKAAGLNATAVLDQGRTIFSEPTWTVGVIAPAMPDVLKPITGRLRLYRHPNENNG